MVERKHISLTIIIHEPANVYKHYFAKFLFTRLTELPTYTIRTERRKNFFHFSILLMFSSPETYFSASGWDPN